MSNQGQLQCGLSTAVALTLKSNSKAANQRCIHAAAVITAFSEYSDNPAGIPHLLSNELELFHTLTPGKKTKTTNQQQKPLTSQVCYSCYLYKHNPGPFLTFCFSHICVGIKEEQKTPIWFLQKSPCARAGFPSRDLCAAFLTSAAIRLGIIQQLVSSK